MFRKLINRLMRSLGYVRGEHLTLARLEIRGLEKELHKVVSQCEELIRESQTLKNEIALLVDENQSLWGMLDEIQASNNFGTDQVKSMMKDIEEAMTDEMLKNFKPVGEA
tara:strand:+ start:206 stop:535 length:330 start_codon:yes stop_codon:yes gene_type:complete